MIGEFVVVRTYTAGVHTGYLQRIHGTAAELTEARRVWRWKGANSLHELALHGAAEEWTRISEPVERILLTEVTEVIPCSEDAAGNLRRSRWGRD